MNREQIPEMTILLDLIDGLTTTDRRQARRLLLELLSSPAPRATTASPTTAADSAAATSAEPSTKPAPSVESETASTEAATPLLQRLLGALTEAERFHVEPCSTCMGRLGMLASRLETHVPAAAGPTSTSRRAASPSSAAISPAAAATSPSSSSSEVAERFAEAVSEDFTPEEIAGAIDQLLGEGKLDAAPEEEPEPEDAPVEPAAPRRRESYLDRAPVIEVPKFVSPVVELAPELEAMPLEPEPEPEEPAVLAPVYDIKRAPGVVEVDNRTPITVEIEEEPETEAFTPDDRPTQNQMAAVSERVFAEVTDVAPASEPDPEPVTEPVLVCICDEDWWRTRRRFDARVPNEAHVTGCPLYRQGAHYFPLPGPGESDGSGVYVSKCLWCGETKEMRPYGEDSGRPATLHTAISARRDAIVFPTSPTEEAIAAARAAKKCVDCEVKTTGMGARCATCGSRQRAALRKQEQDAAVAGALA